MSTTRIIDAVATYKTAKREELVKAVEEAKDAYDAAWDAYMTSKIALKAYDKENTTEKLYYELLYAVNRIHPNETRHAVALRYIREAETTNNSVGCKEPKKENT